MLYFTANGVKLSAGYTPQATFPTQGRWAYPMNKLDAFVNSVDAVVQILTEEAGWQDDQAQEILFRIGFNARDPLPPFYAVRFKIWSGTQFTNPTNPTVDVAAFAV